MPERERYRSFLIERLPEPLSYASRHLQIIDRYICGTSVRLRRIRDPHTNAVNYFLQKNTDNAGGNATVRTIEEIHLDERDRAVFDSFSAIETRRNRYFHDVDRTMMVFDVYLGSLLGLTMARVIFPDDYDTFDFEPPHFAIYEITNDEYFASANLAHKSYEAVSADLDRLGHVLQTPPDLSDN